MDEIDAALDFRNVSIVASYIAERTKNAQFVIISLRNNMFELADRLVGIYKTNDCTKSIAINPSMIAMLTELHQPENPSSTQQQQQSQSQLQVQSQSLAPTSRNPTPT
ncbi:RecF/RecN/SMC N terminal domain-containing protein [Zychaea mexicana]|uniref:RecF/RecN/SMC N terminal domain-containing protein n=1 Tax=Zychaea mexicana TaxID=64656 RepID=UPI0022FDB9A1|nr:RecF/RecN/SMC N terminal domain-containing protein [Zychaea mexicana]KAI9484435.1 RecF/RecN/SMC N terminal domain-containing protein [Zychaea mexicana]